MCYINGIKVSLATFLQYKKIQKELKAINEILRSRGIQKGFEYSTWPVIKASADGKDWDVVEMEWGFLPNNLKNADAVHKFRNGYKTTEGKFITPFTTLNAMGEELLSSGKMFREAALHNRCLVLSSGFYEHRHLFRKHKKTGQPLKTPDKYPYHITVPSKEIFMIPGVYNTWTDRDTGETKDTFALITTKANKLMEQVHNTRMRMPVIFNDEQANRWTEPDLTEKEITALATVQFPAELMDAHTISKTFLQDEDPNALFVYPEVPELIR